MTARQKMSALVGLALMAGACGAPAPQTPPETGTPLAVAVGVVDERDWPSLMEAGGVLRSQTTAVISSRLLAPVVAVHVRPGDRVTRGQVLVELDAAAPRAAEPVPTPWPPQGRSAAARRRPCRPSGPRRREGHPSPSQRRGSAISRS